LNEEEILLQAITRRLVRVAVIKDAEAFDRLKAGLAGALTRAFDENLRQGIVRALDRLQELGPGAFTQADGELIVRELQKEVGEEALMAAVRGPVLNLSEALYRLGAAEIGAAAGIDIAFGRADLNAIDILSSGNLYWVGNSWNTYTLNTIQAILKDYFEGGMNREQLTERFAKDFAGMSERSRHYWELLADHTATKTREMGRIKGYEDAGLRYVQVRAHLDERTTAICRHMHGKIIAVSALREQTNRYLEAAGRKDFEAAKAAWPMHPDSASFDHLAPDQVPANTASPPYHFRCRTITVAYFGTPP
jgi:SPP1 gp7 family putative phage head morphogenesis protein